MIYHPSWISLAPSIWLSDHPFACGWLPDYIGVFVPKSSRGFLNTRNPSKKKIQLCSNATKWNMSEKYQSPIFSISVLWQLFLNMVGCKWIIPSTQVGYWIAGTLEEGIPVNEMVTNYSRIHNQLQKHTVKSYKRGLGKVVCTKITFTLWRQRGCCFWEPLGSSKTIISR